MNNSSQLDASNNASQISKPSLLLHVCCAPCAPHVINQLRENYSVSVFFYNPNIHPVDEYEKRLAEIKGFASQDGFELIIGNYNPESWHDAVRGFEKEPEGGARCGICYRMRLEQTAGEAASRRFDYIATTLSISPHKNAVLINEIGKKTVEGFELKYFEADFKKKNGFKISCDLARDHGFYRQNFCGCVYSRR